MIGRLTHNSGVSPATELTRKAESTKTLCHTPFGDVMVDELSTANRASAFPGRRSAPAVAQPAIVARATQAAVATATSTAGTAKPAAAAPTQQAAPAAATPPESTFPTAESVFGANPWITNPTGTAPDGSTYGYNPLYFATPATAAKIAQLVGGTVVPSNQLASLGGFAQQQPNQMVQLSNGTLINAGLVASFYNRGLSQACIDQMIQNEIQGT